MRDVVSSMTATALIQASNIASGIMLARFLQPDGRGELAAVMLWPTVIAGLGIFGLHEAIAFYAARRRHGERQILRGGLMLAAALSAALLLVGAVVVDLVFAGEPAALREAAFLYLLFIPLNFVGMFLVATFQGALRFFEWNVLRTVVHVFYLLFIPLMYVIGHGGVFGFAAASLLSNAAMILLALAMHRRAKWRAPDETLAEASPRPVWRDLLAYGATVHLGAAIATIAERLDQMIISLTLPAADLGLFVIATTISRLPLVLASTMATVAFPKIASAADAAARAEVFSRYARTTALAILPMSLALAAVMPWLLPLFFGASFSSAVPIAWVLIAAAAPLSMKTMMSAGFKASDRGLVVGQTEIVTLVLSAGMLAWLVPLYGLMGAAVASVIAQNGALAFMTLRARRVLGISGLDLLRPQRADVALLAATGRDLWRVVAARGRAA